MAKVLVTEQHLSDIADAIRAKLGVSDTYTPAQMAGAIEGISGNAYTLTTILPQQTFTAQESTNNSYQASLTFTSELEDGEAYLVTFDGEQYACECGVLWGTDHMAGAIATFWGDRSVNPYPFGIDYAPSTHEFAVGTFDLNQHTIKVEHIEFVDWPLNLIAKSVTENGTYNASQDNADGYSSVTVNVPSGGGGATLYKINNNGGRSAPDTITIDGTTYDEDFSNVRMGYAPAGATVSFCYDYNNDWVFDSVIITGSSTQVPVTTRTTQNAGYTVYMFTMPDADVTINSYYDD